MAEKLAPCCARKQGKLVHDQNNLRSLAKKAAALDAKGRDISRYREMIAEVKATIERDRQIIIDHEAEHAGEGEA